MRAIPLEFDATGCHFNLALPVLKNFAATVQNVLVNTGTMKGSAPVFPDRGTNLQKDGSRGRMINGQLAQHSANFAAMDTLLFCRQTEMAGQDDLLQNVQLEVVGIAGQMIGLAAQVTSSRGEVVGRLFAL